MKKQSETDLVRTGLLRYLKLRGIPCWRQNQGGVKFPGKNKDYFVKFTSVKGISDILGLLPPHGRFLAIEAKVGKNKPTEDQLAFLDMVRRNGGVAIVAYSVDDVICGLESAGWPEKRSPLNGDRCRWLDEIEANALGDSATSTQIRTLVRMIRDADAHANPSARAADMVVNANDSIRGRAFFNT